MGAFVFQGQPFDAFYFCCCCRMAVEEINRDCPTPPPTGVGTTPEGIADALACRPIQPWDNKKRNLW